jgi:hypothetical protein
LHERKYINDSCDCNILGSVTSFPPSQQDLIRAKIHYKDAEFRRWSEQLFHGQEVQWFRNNPIGNHWLLNQQLLRLGQFIDGVKLCTNTFGTRAAIHSANRQLETICRLCRLKPETLGHVIGECSAGQRAQIERHNWIVGKIEEDCRRRGAIVAREQTFELGVERLRPDLVVVSRDRAMIVDVTVPYENGDCLSIAALRKKETCQPLLPSVQRQFNTTKGEVIPVVVGARGAIPQATVTGSEKDWCDGTPNADRLRSPTSPHGHNGSLVNPFLLVPVTLMLSLPTFGTESLVTLVAREW